MKILLATDGSKFSEAAIKGVVTRIVPKNAEVQILQVVEVAAYSAPPQMAAGYAPELAERKDAQMKEAKASVAAAAVDLKAAGFSTSTRVVEADPRTAILEVAEEWKADLIVMGSQGRKGIKRFLLGSVAESVARHARCSVLIERMPS
jgi:nucleotide-binding universal stress UspA family protein